ncbi:hypothetical protein BDN72DRAFT_890866 [Pluteus cervinus]|uniref:Uncharacterized protein n=1 Tax=Pluteus cervinus TaxID=181527 RepID=A0ACD3BGS3_9AGAR|nr:hypothetical protein BDN72DRAFT_890866 [Pluteus cervinus]
MSSAHSMPQFLLQIDQIDHTLVQPGSLDNSPLLRAPVIRIYGTSSMGTKACVNIHQVYPYFYVDYGSRLEPRKVKHYVSKLQNSLNRALALSLKQNPDSPRAQYIRAIVLVKGVHFYGFHFSYSPFLKILMVDPHLVSRAVSILQSGMVMATQFRVYESHLSFILQFLCDFGLYGCGTIEFERVLQRGVDEDDKEFPFEPSDYHRQSRMPLEVDAIAPHILNRRRIVNRDLHHKLQIPAPLTSSEPLVESVRELWEDERKRRKEKGLNPSPELPVDPTNFTRGPGGDWVSEARWWEDIKRRIEFEATLDAGERDPPRGWEQWTMSTFQSIEAIWEDEWKTWAPTLGAETSDEASVAQLEPLDEDQDSADVDVSFLDSRDFNVPPEEEDPVWNLEQEEDGENENELDEQDARDAAAPQMSNSQVSDVGQVVIRESTPENPFIVSQTNGSPSLEEYRLPDLPGIDFLDPPSSPLVSEYEFRFPTPTEDESITPTKRSFSERSEQHDGSSHELIDPGSQGTTPRPAKKRKVTFAPEGSAPPDGNFFAASSSPVREEEPEDVMPIVSKRIRPSHVPVQSKVVNLNRYVYSIPPPSTTSLLDTLEGHNAPRRLYRPPYYSKNEDAPTGSVEFGGLAYHLKGGSGVTFLDEWVGHDSATFPRDEALEDSEAGGWEYASSPPSAKKIRQWLKSPEGKYKHGRPKGLRSQIKGPTLPTVYGFKESLDENSPVGRERQAMSLLSLEVFAPSREEKLPDPQKDAIAAVFYTFQGADISSRQTTIIAVNGTQLSNLRLRSAPIQLVPDEMELINRMLDIVIDLDPDILVGWDVQRASWGYLEARGQLNGLDVTDLLARAPPRDSRRQTDRWGSRNSSNLKVTGRHVFNAWRLMRSEQNFTSHTFEHVAFHLLHKRFPWYSASTLTEMYSSSVPRHTASLLQYFVDRTCGTLDILEKSDIVTKTAEFARVFGVDFFSVISRGSQFKVESFMLRIAKPESFVLLSPSKTDVGKQNAAECMPLIMEPLSAFYTSPLLVLDFQSLYPSIMIAYNYCYSTCLGRINEFKGQNKLGVVDLIRPPGVLGSLQDHINVAPNGILYVKPEVRKGLLSRMLTELLDTRLMVKQAMKSVKKNKALSRVLDARQLSLKYICNVTYGYTSATYSGRMPAVEIADSIVQSGRETLEKAIAVINSTQKWGAQVVYGDTDSVFVYLQGKTKDEAFRIGADIANTITSMNPAPIKLKFEKVYLPCVLLAKKRYVGFKYEDLDEKFPAFDAKGIETVRRDGVVAQRKMLEHCLKILFRSQDLSEVKEYCCRSWTKLLEHKASVQDFIFSREVKMGSYSDRGPPPPGVAVAARRMVDDPTQEPQYGERVPYVIARITSKTRLVDRAMDPLDFLSNQNLQLDAVYYITRVLIPPLERVFNLVGADVRQWFEDMPKIHAIEPASPSKHRDVEWDRLGISDHFQTSFCLVCGGPAPEGLCMGCWNSSQDTLTSLSFRKKAEEKQLITAHQVCVNCTDSAPSEPIKCQSLDCPWFYARTRAESKTDMMVDIHHAVNALNEETLYGPKEVKDDDEEIEGPSTPRASEMSYFVQEFQYSTP